MGSQEPVMLLPEMTCLLLLATESVCFYWYEV